MKKYSDMSKEELLTLKAQLDKEYADIKAKGLALDMSRGKPSADQLDLSMGLMNVLSSDSDLKCETGVDCRNYGVIDGIPEAKRLLGEMSEVDPDHIIIYQNDLLVGSGIRVLVDINFSFCNPLLHLFICKSCHCYLLQKIFIAASYNKNCGNCFTKYLLSLVSYNAII